MVIALSQHCLEPPSSNSPSSPSTRDPMSSKPGLRQKSAKKIYPVTGVADTAAARTDMTPLMSRGVPANSLPRLSSESHRSLDQGKRARRVVRMRRTSEGSLGGSSRLSTVVELPVINTRRHSVAGTVGTADKSNLEVFFSPSLKRCSSFGDATAAHAASSSFKTTERPLLVRRSGPETTPIPPSSPRSSHGNSSVELNSNKNRPALKTSYDSSRHFELTLQKIEETKPHLENGFPSRPTRKVVQRKNAVSSMDRPYLGGMDYQEFRSSLESRRYANISEIKPEYAEELLSHNEEDIGLQGETEDEQLRHKCQKWLETLPQK